MSAAVVPRALVHSWAWLRLKAVVGGSGARECARAATHIRESSTKAGVRLGAVW